MYRVPLFIKREAKIVWFLTFKQFIFVAVAAALCFFLYFTIAKMSFLLFILLSIILMVTGFAFAFLKIGGISLPTVLQDFFSFLISSKKYLWKRKRMMPKIVKKKEPEEIVEKTPPLRVVERSRLRRLSVEIETKK